MNVVSYIRVSTATQVEEGFGLEVQERAVADWAARHGHVITAQYVDAGVSGTKEAADRPGLASALAALEDGVGEALVVPKLDRLARHLTVQEAVLAQAWRHGGRVFAVDVGEILRDDPEDPMRTAMRQMVGVFAQLERAMIAARLRAGRRLKGAKGGYAFGAPRFGQVAEDKELAPEPEEQATIGRIIELRRRVPPASLREIARALEAEGRRTKRGGRWHPGTLGRIVGRIEADDQAVA